MAMTGGCYCGKVRYEVEGEPMMRGLCHCRECQYFSGGGANVLMAFPAAGFRYTAGEPKSFERDDLETPVRREFCPDCGTSLVSRPGAMPDLVIVKVGTLDDPAQYGAPEMAFFMADSQQFHYLPEGIPTFDGFPG